MASQHAFASRQFFFFFFLFFPPFKMSFFFFPFLFPFFSFFFFFFFLYVPHYRGPLAFCHFLCHLWRQFSSRNSYLKGPQMVYRVLYLSLIHISEPRDGLLSRMPSSA